MIMKGVYIFSRIFTGLVFTFSGFSKAVDPVGTQIKFQEYFEAMGLEFLMPFALILSFLMNAAEFIIGLMLLFNIFTRLSSWSALIFLAIFTPVTFWLAVANPVTDCGCFGDALPLTNWQTFWKNVFFLLIIIYLLVFIKKFFKLKSFKKSLVVTIVISSAVFAFEFYNFYNLPVVDFRPFKEGVNIKKASEFPEDAEHDVYETKLFYKNLNTGISKEFSIDNIPYEDTLNWAYDTTITELVSKGYEPPIHDFYLTSLAGIDITGDILDNEDISFIIVMHDMENAIKKMQNEISHIADYSLKNNLKLWCFTSSESSVINKHIQYLPENLMVCTGDYKMLKTLIRSNPGLVILKNAVILKKYHYLNFPDINEIKKLK